MIIKMLLGQMAYLGVIGDDVKIEVFHEHFDNWEEPENILRDFEIVVIIWERTRFLEVPYG